MTSAPRVVAVVTGTRAEYGLLRPVMHAIATHPDLDLRVLVTGVHLLAPARTADEVAAAFPVAATIEMQRAACTGRLADAAALGRGVSGFAAQYAVDRPDIVLVLGDRIEPLAATTAAAVAGIRVAHVHGGDRAEGVADESIRHAITKLAHVHLAATAGSAARIRAMGEDPDRIHVVGSPAVDDLDTLRALDDTRFAALGRSEIVLLHHPVGDDDRTERTRAERLLASCRRHGRVLALDPNHDPGRDGIVAALDADPEVSRHGHLSRAEFIGLLRRVRVLVGNSSSGLIECAALPCHAIDVGDRQGGREKAANVRSCPDDDRDGLEAALRQALAEPLSACDHPYGDGHAGTRIAAVLAGLDSDKCPLRKRNTY